MNILLSRILTYLNGTLFHDFHYKICTFIIFHYLEIEDMSEEEFLHKGCFKKEQLYSFISLLGFETYEDFRQTLINHYQTRLNQIRVRMVGVDSRDLIRNMDKDCTDEEMEKIIDLYDYIEVMPIDNNRFMIEKGEVKDEEELEYIEL